MTTFRQFLKVFLTVLVAVFVAALVWHFVAAYVPGIIRSVGPGDGAMPVHFRGSIGFPELLVLFVLVMPFFFVLLAMIIGAIKGDSKTKDGKGDDLSLEDIETIQEMHRGFEKMGERLEVLETILLEQSGRR